MNKNGRLDKNHELPILTEKHRELGGCCPGNNCDECKRRDDYMQADGDEYGRLKK